MNFSKQEFWYYTRRAFWILVAWVLIFNALFFVEYLTLVDSNALASDFDFEVAFTANLVVSIIAGVIGGTLTVNFMEYSLRKFAFWKALLVIAFVYLVAAFIVSFAGAIYYFSDYLGKTFLDPEVIDRLKSFFASWMFIKNLIIWLFIVIGTLIVMMINDKYGPGVFPDYLKGKYFMPKKERRIFMFADIRDATTIAEAIGEEKYFHFLKDFFNDIAPAILQTKGEVYQYVGDEVVISWKMKQGLKNGNALSCFYKMQTLMEKNRNHYMDKYNHFPEFKAGLHCGSVMVGELGKIKKDIAFSGDVLNTTARIQSECNLKKVDILASSVFGQLSFRLPEGIEKVPLGEQMLKGKTEVVGLVTYRKNT